MAQQQPQIIILPEGAMRTQGRDAQGSNIMAAKALAAMVRSTLGPRGMDKMLVDDLGDIVVTNDGATIVSEMKVEHPAAKMVIEVAKTQDEEVGDGTTTAVVMTGELLSNAEKLLEQGIHSTVIARGYRMAAKKTQEVLERIGKPVGLQDKATLKKIAATSMTGKSVGESREHLSEVAVSAVTQVAEDLNGRISVDLDNIQVEKKQGGSVTDTELIKGIVLDKEVVHPGMPKKVENARIALVDGAFEVKKTETDAQIQITDPSQLQAFLDQEEKGMRDLVDAVVKSGANVLLCQKGIEDIPQHYLAKAKIMAVKNVKESDMKKLAKATGARVITRVRDISKEDLGNAKIIEEVKTAGDEMIYIRDCKNPKAVSILVRGGTEHVVDEAERSIHDALGVTAAALEQGKYVAGGGAVEIELAKELRKYADSIGGREQLAVNAFADALEVIPKTLAESAGMDAIDTLVTLRSKHDGKDGVNIGVNVLESKVGDMAAKNVLEPMKLKSQVVKSASEATEMILRIDDIIASSNKNMPAMPPGGGMGGMDY
ncbi:MAG: TCP-1/cpn60 chaperonin family protein [Candidatus Altiarchaeota archaeon]|nr:TCP-1/cpn60 chaperonin family protein [Candidatus Altiarchaeota archaeon]